MTQHNSHDTTDGVDRGVQVHKCSTWDEFTFAVRKISRVAPRLFRGQRDVQWKLASPWERYLSSMRRSESQNVRDMFAEGSYESWRDGYLNRFKELATGLPGIGDLKRGDYDWWSLGRNHGLITPYLDWTRSPYIAAYFAFMDHAEHNNPGLKSGMPQAFVYGGDPVAVWSLYIDDDLRVEDEFEFQERRMADAYRQKAQQGVFTRLEHPVHLNIESYLASRQLMYCLERYEISAQAIGKAFTDLNLMNITPSTVFPDPGGAAEQANLWGSGVLDGFVGSLADHG